MSVLLWAAVVVLTGWVTVEAGPGQERATQDSTVDIPLETYMGMLETVQVEIGGQTMPFIFDTAGGMTILTPAVADRLGLERFGRVTGFRMSGERVDLERCQGTTVRMGLLQLSVEPVVFDLMSLLPEGWPEIGGLISLHTLKDRIVTLDLGGSRIAFETEAGLPDRVLQMTPVRARFGRQAGGAALDLFLEVKAPGGNLWMEVDSGNTGPVLLAPHALQQLGITEADSSRSWQGQCTLDFGGDCALVVEAARKDLIYDGVLNLHTLKTLVMTIDFPGERVWLARR
jgi:predicted aspartyl protease